MQLEKGSSSQDAATTLHPCWEAYKLEDKYGLVILFEPFLYYNDFLKLTLGRLYCIHFRRELVLYLNVFSGDATTEFPSTLQLARGGVRIFSILYILPFFR